MIKYMDWYCRLDDNKWGDAFLSAIFLVPSMVACGYLILFTEDK